MRSSDITGLNASRIQDLYDLPYVPTHIVDVTLPAGTHLRTGVVNSGNYGGTGGAIQFEYVGQGRLPGSSFSNIRPLEYDND